RVGAHEGDEEPREPVREHADAPEFERDAETLPLLVVEFDGLAGADGFEAVDDRVHSAGQPELREQIVALVPRDLDDFALYVDLDSVEAAAFHAGGTAEAVRG